MHRNFQKMKNVYLAQVKVAKNVSTTHKKSFSSKKTIWPINSILRLLKPVVAFNLSQVTIFQNLQILFFN